MRDDVCVVIRSCNERTESFCRDIVEKQVLKENIFIIHEKPFSSAVKKTFEIGLSSKKKWTLAIDADMIIFNHTISKMISNIQKKMKKVFVYQGYVYDKLFGGPRKGGPHLYNTIYLKDAIDLLETYKDNYRPESTIYKHLEKDGISYVNDNIIYGYHDYCQYRKDIFRKAYFHAFKHSSYIGSIVNYWIKNIPDDDDYLVALHGLFNFITKEIEINVNSVNNYENITKYLAKYNIYEKDMNITQLEINRMYSSCGKSNIIKYYIENKIKNKLISKFKVATSYRLGNYFKMISDKFINNSMLLYDVVDNDKVKK